jgi:hypothetical protein
MLDELHPTCEGGQAAAALGSWLERWSTSLVAGGFAQQFETDAALGEEAELRRRLVAEAAAKAAELAGPEAGAIERELAHSAAMVWMMLRWSEADPQTRWQDRVERLRRSYARLLVDLARVKRLKLPVLVQVNALALVAQHGGGRPS